MYIANRKAYLINAVDKIHVVIPPVPVFTKFFPFLYMGAHALGFVG
jgi:hypothetical protein